MPSAREDQLQVARTAHRAALQLPAPQRRTRGGRGWQAHPDQRPPGLQAMVDEMEGDWLLWLLTMFPDSMRDDEGALVPLAQYHEAYWHWLWAIEHGKRPRPYVDIRPRGAGKSTDTERGLAALGLRNRRKYALYVCAIQEQADDHLQNVGALLEGGTVARFYPEHGEALVGKFGSSLGWRRNRLRTMGGFTIDALGLDVASRGVKLEDQRPDVIVLDDVDEEDDGSKVTARKVRTITQKILPAGSDNVAVMFVQNMVHERSIASLLCGKHVDGKQADFLADRIVSGPHLAVEDLEYEQVDGRFVITGGTPTWAGMDLLRCQQIMDTDGFTSFMTERQHHVEPPPGGMFDHLDLDSMLVEWSELPELVETVVWVDPAVTANDDSDACGICAMGKGVDKRYYVLYAWEQQAHPDIAMRRAIRKAVELGGMAVGFETDQGGETWESVYREAWQRLLDDASVPEIHREEWGHSAGANCILYMPGHTGGNHYQCKNCGDPGMQLTPATWRPHFRFAKAGASGESKAHRASQMLVDMEHGLFKYVRGTHQVAFRALRRFPRTKPFDYVDGQYWSWADLRGPAQQVPGILLQGTAKRRMP